MEFTQYVGAFAYSLDSSSVKTSSKIQVRLVEQESVTALILCNKELAAICHFPLSARLELNQKEMIEMLCCKHWLVGMTTSVVQLCICI